MHPDDARRAPDAGMDGVVVSNHGGRQVDGAIAALDALPAVVAAVGGRAEVLFDSGIRTGADVSRRSRWAPRRCWSDGRSRTAWRTAARTASGTCCAACSPTST